MFDFSFLSSFFHSKMMMIVMTLMNVQQLLWLAWHFTALWEFYKISLIELLFKRHSFCFFLSLFLF